jgi:hypothetical protein
VEVWPNPVRRQLTVDSWQLAVGQGSAVGGQRSAVKIAITDLLGKSVIEFDNISSFPYIIDVSGLNPGIYILQMSSEDGIIGSAKFIKIED